MKPNGELKPFSRFIGFATTSLGKKMGVSGWLSCPDSRECLKGTRRNTCAESPKSVCVTGSVCASATSTDGLASIDLAVSKIEFCREVDGCADQVTLNDLDPVNQRYLRIEYRYKRHRVPKEKEQVRFCGRLRWDTDQEGWWEIHTDKCHDVHFLGSGKDGCR